MNRTIAIACYFLAVCCFVQAAMSDSHLVLFLSLLGAMINLGIASWHMMGAWIEEMQRSR